MGKMVARKFGANPLYLHSSFLALEARLLRGNVQKNRLRRAVFLRGPSGREEKHNPNRGFRSSIGCRGLAGQPVWGQSGTEVNV